MKSVNNLFHLKISSFFTNLSTAYSSAAGVLITFGVVLGEVNRLQIIAKNLLSPWTRVPFPIAFGSFIIALRAKLLIKHLKTSTVTQILYSLDIYEFRLCYKY